MTTKEMQLAAQFMYAKEANAHDGHTGHEFLANDSVASFLAHKLKTEADLAQNVKEVAT